jgi:hypothetical protein
MNVPAHIKARSAAERLERFVSDTQHILVKRKAERVLEARERELKRVMRRLF